MRTLRHYKLLLTAVLLYVLTALGADTLAAGGALTPLAAIKQLPDGASVCISQKPVTFVNNSYCYVGETDRSAGIKIIADMNTYPAFPELELNIGHRISIHGIMGSFNGERLVIAQSPLASPLESTTQISPVGMTNPAIQGWPIDYKNIDGPRWVGLVPYGLYTRIWGRITSTSYDAAERMWYVYLDDGWHKKDGTTYQIDGQPIANIGIRIYVNNNPGAPGQILGATGVLSTSLYDPTPSGPEGDEFYIPVIRCTYSYDIDIPGTNPVHDTFGPVSGTVRLSGQESPGKTVSLYSEVGKLEVENVTDQPKPFNFPRISANGSFLTACAPGYLSATIIANAGSSGHDIVLEPTNSYCEIWREKVSVDLCGIEKSLITAMIRDYEGKGVRDRIVKISSSLGVLTPAPGFQIIEQGDHYIKLMTDNDGKAYANLSASYDGPGTAIVKASDNTGSIVSRIVNVSIRGPRVDVSASPSYLETSGSSQLVAHVYDEDEPMQNVTLVFKTSFGYLQPHDPGVGNEKRYTTTTNADGEARVTVVLPQSGVAEILAEYSSSCQFSYQTLGWTVVSSKTVPFSTLGTLNASPLLVDLDGAPDGVKEIVIHTEQGDLTALDPIPDPSNPTWPVIWTRGKFGAGANTPSCTIVDADRSGRPCVFLPAESQQFVYAFTSSGQYLAGWPARSRYSFFNTAATLADCNLDGSPEIMAGDQCCYVFAWNPTGNWDNNAPMEASPLWTNLTGSSNTVIRGSTCAVGDISSDGNPDVIIGSITTPGDIYAFPGNAWGDKTSAPLYLEGWPKAGVRVESSPVIGDINGDGANDVIWGSDSANLSIWLNGSETINDCPTGGYIKSSPALADLNDDGTLDIIVGSNSGRVFAFNWRGESLPGWGGGILLNSSDEYNIESSPVVGDINGDGALEVIIGCDDGKVYAIYHDGVNHRINGNLSGPFLWAKCCIPPGMQSSKILSAPAMDDIDNDGLTEIVVTSEQGVYIIQTNGPWSIDPAVFPWPTFHHDNQRTGCSSPQSSATKVSIQGIIKKNGIPVANAKVYITHQDGTPVYSPSDPLTPRSCVYSVGSTYANAVGIGAYSINQLEPNSIYKLRIEIAGNGTYYIENISVTTGLKQVDADL